MKVVQIAWRSELEATILGAGLHGGTTVLNKNSWCLPRRTMGWLRRATSAAFAAAVWSISAVAVAQTWHPPRTTPLLLDIAEVDATGEPRWPFGAEDVAGDGLARFQPQEQAIDFRTVYAVAGANELWVRAYVSASSSVGNVRLFLFVDNDRNPSTGGSAAAISLDERFDYDPTPGGYEYVVVVRSDESLEGIWRWSPSALDYEPLEEPEAGVENGNDEDPVRIGASTHAYLQLTTPLVQVGLTSSCNAHLFVRTLNEGPAALGPGDLDVGAAARCTSVSSPSRQFPPALVPRSACSEDAECPAGGLCFDGRCVVPELCRQDGDCDAGEVCDDGLCVFSSSSTTCSEDAVCGDLVCDMDAGLCAACTTDASCGNGRRCAATGRCVDGSAGLSPTGDPSDGIGLEDGEKIQGGAFTCAWRRPLAPHSSLAILVGAGLWWARRRARVRSMGTGSGTWRS